MTRNKLSRSPTSGDQRLKPAPTHAPTPRRLPRNSTNPGPTNTGRMPANPPVWLTLDIPLGLLRSPGSHPTTAALTKPIRPPTMNPQPKGALCRHMIRPLHPSPMPRTSKPMRLTLHQPTRRLRKLHMPRELATPAVTELACQLTSHTLFIHLRIDGSKFNSTRAPAPPGVTSGLEAAHKEGVAGLEDPPPPP